jgi:hypothetical protein
MRADLVALGVRLGWVGAEDKEEHAFKTVMDRLRDEGEGILLIYDNAIDAALLRPYLPRGGAAKVLVTSNAHAWRGVAEPVENRLWPKETGADYLVKRTGRAAERTAAEGLSDALGGMPLAHEQAAAYCERLEVRFAEYQQRLRPRPYVCVTMRAMRPPPIPLFCLPKREEFGEPLASALAGDGLDEAVAALRTFALLDREAIADEREPAMTTDTIRLHRLVRQVAAARREGEAWEAARCALV